MCVVESEVASIVSTIPWYGLLKFERVIFEQQLGRPRLDKSLCTL